VEITTDDGQQRTELAMSLADGAFTPDWEFDFREPFGSDGSTLVV
jgi:hypothetical protein